MAKEAQKQKGRVVAFTDFDAVIAKLGAAIDAMATDDKTTAQRSVNEALLHLDTLKEGK